MVDYLDREDALTAIEARLGRPPEIRDHGVLEAALHRPQATWYGQDIYPDLDTKAAALLLSLVSSGPLVEGSKRMGWIATRLFYVLNGRDLRMPEDEAYDLVVRIAAGEEDDVADVAATLRRWVDAV